MDVEILLILARLILMRYIKKQIMKEFKGTNGKWSSGLSYSVVTSDQAPKRAICDDRDYESEKAYYGGYIICESIPTPEDSRLIAAAPELLAELQHCVRALKIISSFGATQPIIEHAEKVINKALEI